MTDEGHEDPSRGNDDLQGQPETLPAGPVDSGGGPSAAPPKRARWPWFVLGILVLLAATVAWTKTVQTDGYCTTCHAMDGAAASNAHSVHSDVPCLTCHQGPGVRGAVTYIPTALREWIDQLTPISAARGVLPARACDECHQTIFTSPLLKEEHPDSGCADCHGDTSHPRPITAELSEDSPHPTTWVQTHGRDASEAPRVCATCHTEGWCMTCHFKSGFPHPSDWIQQHGQEFLHQGSDACTLCHASTFCASCHGTEIPHSPDWLTQHPEEVAQKDNRQQCLMCHVRTDCTFCHIRHAIHPEQGLYYEEPPR